MSASYRPDAAPPAAGRSNRASLLSADLTVVGQLTSTGDLVIEGRVDGQITARGLTVGAGGTVSGDLIAESVTVEGTATGTIRARAVRLSASARVEGDITDATLAIDSGATVSGRVRQVADPLADAPAALSSPATPEPAAPAPAAAPPAPPPTPKDTAGAEGGFDAGRLLGDGAAPTTRLTTGAGFDEIAAALGIGPGDWSIVGDDDTGLWRCCAFDDVEIGPFLIAAPDAPEDADQGDATLWLAKDHPPLAAIGDRLGRLMPNLSLDLAPAAG